MTGPAARTPFASGGSAWRNLPERRAWWLDLLARAAEAGDLVAEGGALAGDIRFDLVGVAAQGPKHPFPLPIASAQAAVEGFRLLVKGMVTAADPALHAALGGAVAAAARACRRLLEIEQEQQAAAQRRRLGEED